MELKSLGSPDQKIAPPKPLLLRRVFWQAGYAICRFFTSPGGCMRNKCPFKHIGDGKVNNEVCFFFRFNKCTWGRHCKYTHPAPERSSPVMDAKQQFLQTQILSLKTQLKTIEDKFVSLLDKVKRQTQKFRPQRRDSEEYKHNSRRVKLTQVKRTNQHQTQSQSPIRKPNQVPNIPISLPNTPKRSRTQEYF